MSETGRLTLNLTAETAPGASDWRQGALDISQAQRDVARARASASVAPSEGLRPVAQQRTTKAAL